MRWSFIVGIAVAACSQGGGSAGDTDPDAGAFGDSGCGPALGGADGPLFDQADSRFTVTGDETYLELTGAVWDGPAISFHTEAERVGACRLLTYEEVACVPECGGGEACVGGECFSYPTALSAGTLTLLGIPDGPFAIEPTAEGQYYWSSSGTGVLDVPALGIEAGGGEVGAFGLEACVFPPPSPVGDWSAAMEARADGEDVTLEWANPSGEARVTLRMTTGIGTHGGISPVEIECEGRDTGSLTLPGAFLDQLYGGPYWSCGECGDNRLYRYHAAEASVGGRTVQLRAQSPAMFYYRP